MIGVNMQKALPRWFEKITLLRVRVQCTLTRATTDERRREPCPQPASKPRAGRPGSCPCPPCSGAAAHGQWKIARPLLLPRGAVAVDCGYYQYSRQPYCKLSHRAIAVDHYCPHKAKAVLSPVVATHTREKFMCHAHFWPPFGERWQSPRKPGLCERNASNGNPGMVDTEAR